MPAPAATFLLPARSRLGGVPLPPAVARALGRADRLAAADAGEAAQLQRHFDLLPRGWPVAALTRVLDGGDAPDSAWLRADPAYVRPDINGARLLGTGAALALDRADVDAFLPALRPLFGDAGFMLDAPDPHRWYLRLPRAARLPLFASPAEALGAELIDQLPGAGDDASPEARRWRALLSEAQVLLHNHPRNAVRVAEGRVPVNSLWFWGAGVAPDHVATRVDAVASDDVLLRALATRAGVAAHGMPPLFAAPDGDALFDLRALRDPAAWVGGWLAPAVEALARGALAALRLDCEDGTRLALSRGQRWRFWRRPLATLDA